MVSSFLLKLESKLVDNIIFIVPSLSNEELEEARQGLESDYEGLVDIWNLSSLERIYREIEDNNTSIDDFFNNVYQYYLYDQVNRAAETTSRERLESHKNKLDELKDIYHEDSIVLFLGAGVSADAEIPTWNDLISKLFVELMNSLLLTNNIKLSEGEKLKIERGIREESGFSPIIKTRLLKTGFKGSLEKRLKDLMYREGDQYNTSLINSISELSRELSERDRGVKSIVTYNFDDLVEQNLHHKNIGYESIYSESLLPVNQGLGIYHVHGFLPKKSSEYVSLENSTLVFSEEEYHQIILEPYNWTNLTQLDFLTNDTCVFIGLSLTDPNLRRLLDISFDKRIDRYNSTYHYAFLKKPRLEKIELSREGEEFKKINMELLENFYKELGILIIWIEEYSELPKLLDYISNRSMKREDIEI